MTAWQVFSEVTYGLDELLEKVNVITENDRVTIDLTENSKDALITVMHGQTFGKCYSIHLDD